LMALRSGSKVHFAPFSAAHAGLLLNLPDGAQGADCGPGGGYPNNRATFRINDEGELLLNSVGLIQQRFYTDRSGMGQGILQYNNGTSLPRNAETKGWKIDKAGNLNFADTDGFTVCPNGVDGSWNVWIPTGNAHPGNTNVNCTSVHARTVEVENPPSCLYTTS
ncbi:hypothetical protein H9L39_17557, partial [Fusarium oxysporum f. sp. albedinis]